MSRENWTPIKTFPQWNIRSTILPHTKDDWKKRWAVAPMNRGTIRQETLIEISNEQELEEFASKEDVILKYAIEYRLSSGYRPNLSKDWKHSVRKRAAGLVVQRKKASILYLATAMDEDRWKQRWCDSVFQVIWMASPIVLEHQCLLLEREGRQTCGSGKSCRPWSLFFHSFGGNLLYCVQLPLKMVLVQLPKHLVCSCLIWLVNFINDDDGKYT